MRKIKRKGIVLLMVVTIMVFATGLTCYASPRGNIGFDVTVSSSGNHPDPMSPRKAKEDGEGRYYVTPTWFSNAGEIRGFSRDIPWGYTSYPVSLYSNALYVRVDNPYLISPPAGTECYLTTYWGASSVTNTLNVHGNYTP